MKRINKKFINNVTPIDADDLNDIVKAINDLDLKINYLFYKDRDPQKAAEIMAEILGERDEADFKSS